MGKAMTIDSSLSRIRYVGNGVTTNFSIPFAYLTNNDGTAQLAVYIGDSDTPLIEKDDYTIEGIKGSQVGEAAFEDKFDSGTVIFKTAPESGVAIAVIRNVPQTQSIVFIEGSKFPAQDFENGLDKLTMEVQEVKENLQRAIVLPPTSTENPLVARDNVLRARDEAVQSSNDALRAISEANKTLDEVVKYTDQAVADINTTAETAQANITNAITEALDYVSEEAVNAATNVVADVVGQYTDRAETAAKNAEADASRTAESANQASASATSAATSASEAEAVAGEVSVYNFKNKITNCITEIPQDIKLELNTASSQITLTKGSVIYIPDGFNGTTPKFIRHVMVSGQTGGTGTGNYVYCYNPSRNLFGASQVATSGAEPTSPTSGQYWYDTANNKMKRYLNNAWVEGFSLPFCIADTEKIIHTFNGFGYIGSTAFALPGVKGLIPNGRNADGSLKNEEFTVSNVLTQVTLAGLTRVYGLKQNNLARNIDYVYDERTNLNHVNTIDGQISYEIPAITVVTDSNNAITSFTPKLPFRAVDRNDSSWVAQQAMPSNKYIDLTLGASGASYTAPASGWFYLSKTSSATGQYIAFVHSLWQDALWSSGTQNIHLKSECLKGEKIAINYTVGGTTNTFRFIYAEGEN